MTQPDIGAAITALAATAPMSMTAARYRREILDNGKFWRWKECGTAKRLGHKPRIVYVGSTDNLPADEMERYANNKLTHSRPGANNGSARKRKAREAERASAATVGGMR